MDLTYVDDNDGTKDADADSDGLIEIYTITDFYNISSFINEFSLDKKPNSG